MKRLLMIAAAVLAFAGAAHGLEDVVQEQTYRLNNHWVQVWRDDKGEVEMRFIPGWQLQCPHARWGDDDCNGGQGFLLFIGRDSGEATFDGEARTDRCPELFPAYAERGKGGRVTIREIKSTGGVSKCNVVLIPAKDPRR